MLYNTTISDMEVGYKAFRGDLVRDLHLISDDFRIEPELTAKVLRLRPGIRLYEVPISYYGRSYEEGKKITWRDGFGAVGALVRFRFFMNIVRFDGGDPMALRTTWSARGGSSTSSSLNWPGIARVS